MVEKCAVELLAMDSLAQAAECLKVLAHPVRLRVVDLLMQGEFPVGRIAELCDLPAHQMSEHLRLMQAHGLLRSRRDGRVVFYGVANPNLPGVLKCIRANCGAQAARR